MCKEKQKKWQKCGAEGQTGSSFCAPAGGTSATGATFQS
jgi:hypothetical protein